MTKFSAHDVRKLRVCSVCEDVGFAGDLIEYPRTVWEHPKCFVNLHGFSQVMKLERAQKHKFSLNDLTAQQMKQLVNSLEDSL